MDSRKSIGQKNFFARACAYIVRAVATATRFDGRTIQLIFSMILLSRSFAVAAALTFSQASNDLNSPDMAKKYAAIQALKHFGPQGAVTVLTQALQQQTDVPSRLAILEGLTCLTDSQAIPAIAPLLSDSNRFVRQRAAYAIGMCGGPDAEAAILKALPQEKDTFVKSTEIKALSLCGSENSTPVLSNALKDPDAAVRLQVVHTLGRMHGPKARKVLKSAQSDGDPKVKNQANLEIKSQPAGDH